MQIREQLTILNKSFEDEQEAMDTLKDHLESSFFNTVCNAVLELYHCNDVVYEYMIEEVVYGMRDELQDILLGDIYDYYLKVSENSEAQINNSYNQSNTDYILDYVKKSTSDKNILNDLVNFQDVIQEYDLSTILRQYKVQQNINQPGKPQLLKKPFIDITDITEIFEYEVDQAVTDYLANNMFIATESTLERVTGELFDIIKESYADRGEGTDTVTTDIINKFTELREYEAERIARTETLKAQGNANYMRLLNNDSVEYKQWMATNDSRTRDSHSEQDGQITYVDGTFENGCQYEGDTNAEIEEWITCRCTTTAFYPEPGMVPPAGAEYWFEDEMVIDLDVERYDYLVDVPEFIPSFW